MRDVQRGSRANPAASCVSGSDPGTDFFSFKVSSRSWQMAVRRGLQAEGGQQAAGEAGRTIPASPACSSFSGRGPLVPNEDGARCVLDTARRALARLSTSRYSHRNATCRPLSASTLTCIAGYLRRSSCLLCARTKRLRCSLALDLARSPRYRPRLVGECVDPFRSVAAVCEDGLVPRALGRLSHLFKPRPFRRSDRRRRRSRRSDHRRGRAEVPL